METLSRVKRYEDLRKQIEDDSIGTDTPPEEKLQSYAKRLNEIDPSIFKKVTITEEEPNTPQRERIESSTYEDNDTTMQEFRNEYLDDFINEVREYNIKKGNRESENTQIDILNRLNAVSRAKRTERTDYIQNIEEEISEPKQNEAEIKNRDEIAAQVKSLLEEELPQAPAAAEVIINEAKPSVDATVEVSETRPQKVFKDQTKETKQKTVKEKAAPVIESVNTNAAVTEKQEKQNAAPRKQKPKPVAAKELQAEVEREQRLHQKLVEETQQLRVQLNEYEDDLNDLSEGVEKTNKMLNVILGCLILALLVIIGIIIYWVIQAGGLI